MESSVLWCSVISVSVRSKAANPLHRPFSLCWHSPLPLTLYFSFALKLGRSLLQKGLGPFVLVLAPEADRLALALQVQAPPKRHAQTFVDGLLGHFDGH